MSKTYSFSSTDDKAVETIDLVKAYYDSKGMRFSYVVVELLLAHAKTLTHLKATNNGSGEQQEQTNSVS
jgi:hypothetical protein